MRNINLKYVEEKYGENGIIKEYHLKYPETFNFAYDVMDDMAKNDPNKMAMLWCNPEGLEKIFTFADMKHYSNMAANYLFSLGIKKGDMVMVLLKRHYQYWFVALALHKIGAVLIPASFMLTRHDIEYRVNSADVTTIICTNDGPLKQAVEEAAASCPCLKTKVLVGAKRDGWHDFDNEFEKYPDVWERVPTLVKEPMILYFSSGTSGNPKMVLHNYTYALAHLFTAKHWHNVDSEGLHLSIADTGWGKASWGKFYGQWFMESAIFVYDYEKFVPGDILSLISKYKITTLCCPPTMFRYFINDGLSKYNLSSLKYCTIAGEALNPDVFDNWYKSTGIKLMEGFGQTETTLAICNCVGMQPKPGSMGKPSAQYDVDIVDNDGESVSTGLTGEIIIRTQYCHDGIMDCYYKDDEKTAKAFENGVYHTGDTAWRDEDGYYWYVGRTDDVIKSSGYRIGPFEIESVLLNHPSVSECAITGVPDTLRGQLIKATIVLKEGFIGSDALKLELQAFVKKETAPYKYPRVIDFVDELPKTFNGKIRRAAIRDKDKQK